MSDSASFISFWAKDTLRFLRGGNQLWASRFDSTNYSNATPSGFVLDTSNNVVVTGNALTVKYDSNGNELWATPYSGSSIAIDSAANPIVTGMGANFTTVKLSPSGSNVWVTTYPDSLGPARSEVVMSDNSNNVYVAGSYTYNCDGTTCYQSLLVVKYDQNGSQLWSGGYSEGPVGSVQVEGAALGMTDSAAFVANFNPLPGPTIVLQFSGSGNVRWTARLNNGGVNPTFSLVCDTQSNTVVSGEGAYAFTGTIRYDYATFKLGTNGNALWTNSYPQRPIGSSAPNSIALDLANNSYITGYSPGRNGTNDIVTIKYDPNGNQVWLQRYSSPSGGSAAGNAIAVDGNGNVYVTGYDTTAQGGTEIVTIKYSPVNLQRQPNGTVILQAQGSPGEAFDIEASTNLLDWLDLGTFQADTNGLLQFDDTNAPGFPARFYYTTPQ
jgi:hypothetical protein